jgi:beta-galactosidase
MSPITPTRPDPNQQIADQDMNSWQRIEPGSPQLQWSAGPGYAIYRATFTPPRHVQAHGGRIVFHAIAGEAEIFLDGVAQPPTVQLPPSASVLTLSALIRADRSPAGLTGRVEIVPA